MTARLVGTPLYADEGSNVIHLGGSYIHRFWDGNSEAGNPRFRERPRSQLAQRFVDTGTVGLNHGDILNLEAAGVFGPLALQTEYTNTWGSGAGTQRDVHLWGAYFQASYFLTGEHRVYDHGVGRFRRVKPANSFNPAKGGWGAWEIAARFSYLDLNDRDVTGGELWDITAALNWYLYPNLRWMLNYVHANVSDRVADLGDDGFQGISGAADIVQMRFALDF